MTDFNDMEFLDLDNDSLLSEEERERIWSRIDATLDRRRKRGRFVWWGSPVAAAAVIAAFIFLHYGNTNKDKTVAVAPADGVIAHTLSLTEEQPVKKLQSSDGERAVTPVNQCAAEEHGRKGASLPQIPEPEIDESVPGTEEIRLQPIEYEIAVEEYPVNITAAAPSVSKEKHRKPKKAGKREKIYYADDYDSGKPGRERFAFAASTNISNKGRLGNGSEYLHIKSVASQVNFIQSNARPLIEPISEEENYIPLNFAIQGLCKVSESLSIGVGISYSYLHSRFNGLIDRRTYDIKQHIHYVGVPVNVYYTVAGRGKFEFYVNGGATIEKGVRLHYEMESYGRKRSASTHVKGFQYSLNGGMGAEYRFGRNRQFGMYLEPNAVYYLDSKAPNSIRTERPFQVEAELGLRFHLK